MQARPQEQPHVRRRAPSPAPNGLPEQTFDQLSFDQENIWMDLSSAEIVVSLWVYESAVKPIIGPYWWIYC